MNIAYLIYFNNEIKKASGLTATELEAASNGNIKIVRIDFSYGTVSSLMNDKWINVPVVENEYPYDYIK